MSSFDPGRVRSLAERLVGIPTVGPDAEGARACVEAMTEALPPGVEHGTWSTASGEPVLWARLQGSSERALILLGHYDTVGVSDYAALGTDETIAYRPAELRACLMARESGVLPAEVAKDLAEERATAGTWMFGRGALDMKSGLAAGVAALHALAGAERPDGSVLLLACPDEEGQSAGMHRAVEELAAWTRREGLELRGAINLDYAEEPAAHHGSVGKLLVSLWVRGVPAHAANPFTGVDAVQLAAAIVTRLTTARALVDREGNVAGAPPVALRLRDLKSRYDVQTAIEAEIELNLITTGRTLAETVEALRTEISVAIEECQRAMSALGEWSGRALPKPRPALVLTHAELVARARAVLGDQPLRVEADAWARAREWIPALAGDARLTGPLVVISLLPPYYPHAAPRTGGLADRLRPLLQRRGVPLRDRYPYISDAAYLAWRGDDESEIGPQMPALGRGYKLPIEAARALDLEVVTIGPWGRGAHGLYERVHAPFAFGILPGLIAESVTEALRAQS